MSETLTNTVNNGNKRRAVLFTVIALLVGLSLVVFFFMALSGASNPAEPIRVQPSSSVAANAVDRPSTAAGQTNNQSGASVALPQPGDDQIVALVNGLPIVFETVYTMQGADRALSSLLGRSTSTANVLDRLINGELVQQAASQADFVIAQSEVETALSDFLAEQGLEQSVVDSTLAEQGLTPDAFLRYYGNLLLVDRFSRAQATALGISVSDYIDRLQADAKISFGPGLDTITASDQEEPILASDTSTDGTETASLATPAMSIAKDITELDTMLVQPATEVNQAEHGESDATVRGVKVGLLAPDFSLAAINNPDGDTLTQASLLGQPTVLSFWTTWCPYCRRQTPILVEGNRRYAEQGIRFVGINVKEDLATVEPYLAEHGITYPIALDEDGKIASLYKVRGYPTTYFLDASGVVVAQQAGALTKAQLDRRLQSLKSP
ncbi:MAG: redoxin domain-containing protein [Chloroflexi bacterium]|nr:redoxin domain-containing protein [Chloroflexota bacterium]